GPGQQHLLALVLRERCEPAEPRATERAEGGAVPRREQRGNLCPLGLPRVRLDGLEERVGDAELRRRRQTVLRGDERVADRLERATLPTLQTHQPRSVARAPSRIP